MSNKLDWQVIEKLIKELEKSTTDSAYTTATLPNGYGLKIVVFSPEIWEIAGKDE